MSYMDTLVKFDELNSELGLATFMAMDSDGDICVNWLETAESGSGSQKKTWFTWWPGSGGWISHRGCHAGEHGVTTDPWSACYQAIRARIGCLAEFWNPGQPNGDRDGDRVTTRLLDAVEFKLE